MRTLSMWLMGVTFPSNLRLKEAVPARTGTFICQLFTFWKMTAGSSYPLSRKSLSGIVANGLWGIPDSAVKLHIRDDTDCGRHFLLPGVGTDGSIQKQVKDCFHVGA